VTVEHACSEEELDLEAARLTLVALFGLVPAYEAVDDQHVRIAPDSDLLSVDSASRFLASMPKPLMCLAENVRGTLKVTCELQMGATGIEGASSEARRQINDQRELLRILENRYRDDDDRFLAFGGKASAAPSLATLRRWARDYVVGFLHWCVDDARHDEAERQGAKEIVRFTSPADTLHTGGADFEFPPSDSATPEERRKVEHALLEIARQRLVAITEEEDIAAVERQLVERCEIPADSMAREVRTLESYMDKLSASQMQQFFRDRAMPPEVAAFVDACRAG
jgi:hypothetical protein